MIYAENITQNKNIPMRTRIAVGTVASRRKRAFDDDIAYRSNEAAVYAQR